MKAASLYFLVLAMIVGACKKAEKEPAPHINTLSSSVNSNDFLPSSIEVVYGDSPVSGEKQLTIYAKRADGHELTLIMQNYDGTGNIYTFNPNPNKPKGSGCYRTLPELINASCSSKVGEIRLTSIDKSKYKTGEVIAGTFYFDADGPSGKFKLKNGQFSVFVQK